MAMLQTRRLSLFLVLVAASSVCMAEQQKQHKTTTISGSTVSASSPLREHHHRQPPQSPARHRRHHVGSDNVPPSPILSVDVEDPIVDDGEDDAHGHETAREHDRQLMISRGGAAESGATAVDNGDFMAGLMERLKIASYFALWYALNVIYNIVNKKVLNVLPAPLTVGAIQFGTGALYASSLWILGLRPSPRLTAKGRTICTKIGIYHMAGQLLSMVSLGAGPVSFTHIVKALEPFFSALVSALVFGKWMKWQVYATLIPVVGGVGYACMKERSFSWLAFYTAMGSNVAFALRAVVSKSAMLSYIGENITSTNLFGVVTWFAFLLSVPVALLGEGTSFLDMWSKAVSTEQAVAEDGSVAATADATTTTTNDLAKAVMVSGLFHYLNNEVMYLALGNVHPVTLAVGNTMKRVFIMVASVLVFRNPVSVQAGIGSAVGISGVLLYSLVKQHYEKMESSS